MAARLALRNDAAELVRLTEFADAFARGQNLAEEERSRLLVILDELFSNIVAHGYEGATAAGHIEVTLGVRAGRLIIELIDDGRPFDPLSSVAPDLDLPAQERPIGGLGIAIVRALVDEAGYRREGDRNHLTLGRKLPDRASPPLEN
jgi:anti-sigma regulatory factor (Ser/Thr protein kinase)